MLLRREGVATFGSCGRSRPATQFAPPWPADRSAGSRRACTRCRRRPIRSRPPGPRAGLVSHLSAAVPARIRRTGAAGQAAHHRAARAAPSAEPGGLRAALGRRRSLRRSRAPASSGPSWTALVPCRSPQASPIADSALRRRCARSLATADRAPPNSAVPVPVEGRGGWRRPRTGRAESPLESVLRADPDRGGHRSASNLRSWFGTAASPPGSTWGNPRAADRPRGRQLRPPRHADVRSPETAVGTSISPFAAGACSGSPGRT